MIETQKNKDDCRRVVCMIPAESLMTPCGSHKLKYKQRHLAIISWNQDFIAFFCSAEKALVSHLGCYFKRRLRGALLIVLTHLLLPNGRHHRAEIKTATKSSTAPCFFRLAISMRLCPMLSRVALAVRLAPVGDETKMRMMNIGGAGALQCRLQ